jgi:methionyl-tRNA synthetase
VEWLEEESYFFKLSAFQDKLLDYFAAHPDAIAPKSRYNEIISFIKGGLQDVSVSRTTFDWGVPVPNDPKHVMYVWIDALTNYLSALGFPDDTDDVKNYWPETLHIVGKDIQRFHAVYWPAFLMAAGHFEPPKRVYSHGWLMAEDGRKMSKSFGNVIEPKDFVEKFGLDQTRFLPDARDVFRSGRQYRPRRHPAPQERARQRFRQSRAARADVHFQELQRDFAENRDADR